MSTKKMIIITLILVCLVGGAIIYHQYRQDVQRAYQRLAKRERRLLATSCGPIELAVRGDGPLLLSIHGSVGGFDQGLDSMETQLLQQYQVIAPSRFGYLGTPLPDDATPQAQAEAFVCLLDTLGIEQTAVIAYSAGGSSAIQFAQNYPERVSGLILVSTVVADKPLSLPPRAVSRIMFRSDFIFWLLTHPLRPLGQRMFIPAGYEMSAEDKVDVTSALDSLLPVAPRAEGAINDMYVTNTDPHERSAAYCLKSIQVPTLVINAQDDPLVNYEDAQSMSDRLPHARFVTIAEGGHLLAGSGDRVFKEIDRFLREQLADPAQL